MADQLRRTGWSNLGKLGVKLTTLTPEQAAYLSIDVAGPYKPENYRY